MFTVRKELRESGVMFLAAAVAALSIACGDDNDPGPMEPEPDPPVLGDFPAGTYTTVVAEGDAPFEFLEGQWTLEIQADGDFSISHQAGSVAGDVTVSGNQITLKDLGGELACLSPTDVGTYAWTETATSVAFSIVSDQCDGRRFVMAYAPWTR